MHALRCCLLHRRAVRTGCRLGKLTANTPFRKLCVGDSSASSSSCSSSKSLLVGSWSLRTNRPCCHESAQSVVQRHAAPQPLTLVLSGSWSPRRSFRTWLVALCRVTGRLGPPARLGLSASAGDQGQRWDTDRGARMQEGRRGVLAWRTERTLAEWARHRQYSLGLRHDELPRKRTRRANLFAKAVAARLDRSQRQPGPPSTCPHAQTMAVAATENNI